MTDLERMKLRFYRASYGSCMPSTADEALEMAIEDEAIRLSMKPFDPATKMFITRQLDMERIALLLEKEHASKQNP